MSILPENTSAKLSTLLGRPAGGKLITPEHRKVIGQICADAKAGGMSVEQLIISLKSIFEKIPLNDGAFQTRSEVRERLIAVCIEEYYKDGKGSVSGDGKGSMYGDGKGSMYGDGKGSTYGDGKGSMSGDGKGSMSGDGKSAVAPQKKIG